MTLIHLEKPQSNLFIVMMTASLSTIAAAKDISVSAAVGAVLLELDGILHYKINKEQCWRLLRVEDVVYILPTGFCIARHRAVTRNLCHLLHQ